MGRKFDLIIFGASGYTGKYVIREACSLLNGFKWAIAGRDENKLRQALKEVEIYTNGILLDIAIIVADVNDEKSLVTMARQAKVIVNCCGPYRFYGEAVIKACIQTGTSHVDVSGEPQYMETMQLKYDREACEKNIFIISACGYDSIPADLGTIYTKNIFNGTINSLKIYTKFHYLNNYQPLGPKFNYATYESAIHGLYNSNQLIAVRKELFKTQLPKLNPRTQKMPAIHKSKALDDRWSLTLPVADQSVIMRSLRYFYETENQRLFQVETFTTYDTFMDVLKIICAGTFVKKMTSRKCGRDILLSYPKLFSFGLADQNGPSEERNAKTVYEQYFVADGWREKFEIDSEIKIPMNKQVVTRVICTNPFYGAASKAVLLSAITILKECNKMPIGGVLTPAAAFKNTLIIDRLQKAGVTFELLQTKELKAKL